MGHDDLVIIGRVAGALAFGAMIGFERTFSFKNSQRPRATISLRHYRALTGGDERNG